MGQKVKGTEICGCTVMVLGTSLIGLSIQYYFLPPRLHMHVIYYAWCLQTDGCWWDWVLYRLSQWEHWVATQTKWTKAHPILYLFLFPFSLLSLLTPQTHTQVIANLLHHRASYWKILRLITSHWFYAASSHLLLSYLISPFSY